MQEEADETTQEKTLPTKEPDNATSREAEAVQDKDLDTSKATVRNLSKI